MNDQLDLHIITHHHLDVYCGYFRRLVFGNSLTFAPGLFDLNHLI